MMTEKELNAYVAAVKAHCDGLALRLADIRAGKRVSKENSAFEEQVVHNMTLLARNVYTLATELQKLANTTIRPGEE